MHNLLETPLALLAGLLTIASPCILPVMPILLGTSADRPDRVRPLFIIAGFSLTFASFAMLLGAVSSTVHVAQQALRNTGIVLLALSGLLRLWPRPYDWLVAHLQQPLQRLWPAVSPGVQTSSGNAGGFVLGMSLGAVWTPCAGPVLASILVLVVKAQDLEWSGLLLALYAFGAAIPMLAIIYGGQYATHRVRLVARHAHRLQQVFGMLVMLTALAIYLQYDILSKLKTVATVAMFAVIAATSSAAIASPLRNSVPAPEFTGIEKWLNSDPLTIKQLQGKVVLVDFWTYTCINCVNTLPYVKNWNQKYKDQGLVVIGVHTPEYPFERNTDNVRTAIKRFGISFQVAQDNQYATWSAYDNQYWPAFYLIDKKGQVVYTHFGEGDYAETEATIKALLAQK